jgi:hypothetical protein
MIVALARKLFGSSNEPRIKKRVADGAASRAAAERAPYKGTTRTLRP